MGGLEYRTSGELCGARGRDCGVSCSEDGAYFCLARGMTGVGTRLESWGQEPVGVWAVDAVPLMRYAIAVLVTQTEGFRWAGGAVLLGDLPGGDEPCVLLIDSACDPTLTGTADLARCYPSWTIIVLLRESHCHSGGVRAAVAAGAHGILPRTAEPRAVVTVLDRARRSPRYVDPWLAPLAEGPLPAASESLSPRELEVLSWISDGHTGTDTAETMHLSQETIRTHIKRILTKLGARNRAHAVTRAHQLGLLTPWSHAEKHAAAPAHSVQESTDSR